MAAAVDPYAAVLEAQKGAFALDALLAVEARRACSQNQRWRQYEFFLEDPSLPSCPTPLHRALSRSRCRCRLEYRNAKPTRPPASEPVPDPSAPNPHPWRSEFVERVEASIIHRARDQAQQGHPTSVTWAWDPGSGTRYRIELDARR